MAMPSKKNERANEKACGSDKRLNENKRIQITSKLRLKKPLRNDKNIEICTMVILVVFIMTSIFKKNN